MFKDYTMSYNANINVAGGTRFVKYYAAVDFVSEGDLYRQFPSGRNYNTGYDYKRFNIRSNLDFNITKTTVFKVNIAGSNGVRKSPWSNRFNNDWQISQQWAGIYNIGPDVFLPVYSDGSWGYLPHGTNVSNAAQSIAAGGQQTVTTTRLTTDFVLEQKLDFITKGLSARAMISWDNTFVEGGRGVNDLYTPIQLKWIDPETGNVSYKNSYEAYDHYDYAVGNKWTTQGGSVQDWSTQRNLNYQAQLNWARQFGKHNVTAMGLFGRQETAWGSMIPTYREDWVFRATYDWNSRYFAEYNGAYNGSEKFSPENRFAFFSSGAIGWMVSEEPFMKVLREKHIIDMLKVRASYGELGNSNIGAYSFDEKFSIGTGRWFNGTQVRTTGIPAPIPDNLTWETSKTLDIGLDLNFFRDRLNISADWYQRKTVDMYIAGTKLPDVYGATSPKGNFGEMTTSGYELTVGWRDKFQMAGKPFNYSIKATLADYTSTIDKYNNQNRTIGTSANPSYYEGMTIGELWGWTINGLYQTQEEVDAVEAGAKAAGQKYYNNIFKQWSSWGERPGTAKVEDLNGNGYIDRGKGTVEDPGDRRIIGNKEPRYIYSFNLSADWNGIFVSAFFQGVGKQDWYPSTEAGALWGMYNRPYAKMPGWMVGNMWTPETPDAYMPLLAGYDPLFYNAAGTNTRYMQDVSYIRLKNLQVGYNLPTKWISKIGLKKAAIYFSGENLWTWSPMYKMTRNIDVTANIYGKDQEMGSSGDGYNYPSLKSYSIGLNLTF